TGYALAAHVGCDSQLRGRVLPGHAGDRSSVELQHALSTILGHGHDVAVPELPINALEEGLAQRSHPVCLFNLPEQGVYRGDHLRLSVKLLVGMESAGHTTRSRNTLVHLGWYSPHPTQAPRPGFSRPMPRRRGPGMA